MKKHFLLFLLSFVMYIQAFCQEEKMFWIDLYGNVINPPGDYMDEEYDGIVLFRENNKYGIKNPVGEIKLTATYDLAESVGKGFVALGYKSSEAWYIFNKNGKMVHGSPFRKIHSINGDDKPAFFNGLLPVQSISTGKIGCLDTTGKIVIPEIYDYIKDFGDPVLFIGKDGQHGLMDKKTKTAVLTKYDKIKEFSQGLAAVSKKGKWGYINYESKEVIPLKFISAGYFFNDFAAITDGKAKKFINLKGEITEKAPHAWNTQALQIYEHVMFIKNENKKTALFDCATGKQLTAFKYINDPMFINDYAVCIDSNNVTSLLNIKGKEIKGYDGYGTMNEGLICAYKKEIINDAAGKTITVEKSGYIDEKGNIIIPFNYGGISYFKNGIAKVIRFEDYRDLKSGTKK